ncbi:glycosyltransferase [Eggerthellaceae bacterium zg-887]|uniref:glycosyltransferase family 2 protein n=1 Tax=Xiamenia xianingshaonis TaxID=2682776 RepID=UPI00140C9761|nr:glycosyltransferase [Xiamenia xianingshaonis]NHM16163.1 glycosyltransferase [Xiamenia xianingshaonis]
MACKVSVIIPVFNKEQFLDGCLNTVAAQSLREIEIICIDDGSTDGSLDILKKRAAQDARLRLVEQMNSGASQARNRGIEIANGEYVAFLDADDLYPDCDVLKDLYAAASSSGAAICGGSLYELHDGVIDDAPKSEAKKPYSFSSEGYQEFSSYQFDYGFTRFLYSRKLLMDNNLRFQDLRVYEDPLFFVQAMSVARRFYALPRPSYVYRVEYHEQVWNARKFRDLGKALAEVLVISLSNGYSRLTDRVLERLWYSYIPAMFNNQGKFDKEAVAALRELCEVVEGCRNENSDKVAVALKAIISTESAFLAIPAFSQGVKKHHETASDDGKAKVSVIVPYWNSGPYLEAAVSSVSNQTYDNLEIILVDDGSEDESAEIAEKASFLDSRIVVVRKSNGGLSSARNAGLRVATGDYVIFLDSDDLLVPHAVEKLVEVISKNSAQQVFFSTQSFFDSLEAAIDHSNYLTYYDYHQCYPTDLTGRELFVRLRRNGEFKPSACLQMLEMRLLQDKGIDFLDGITHEDNLFTVQCLSKSERSMVIHDKLHARRVHSNSIMTTKAGLRNAYGYYRCCSGVSAMMFDESSTEDVEFAKAIQVQSNIWINDAARLAKGASSSEISAFLETLAVGDGVMFKGLVLNKAIADAEKDKAEKALKLEKKKSKESLARIRKSRSYRVGHFLLAPFRILKKLVG